MEERRFYRRRGTEGLPVTSLLIAAGFSMQRYCHWHPEPEFIYVVQGSLQKRLGKETVTLKAGDFYIIPPNEIHGIESFSEDAILRRIVFDPLAITMPSTHFFQKDFVVPLMENRLKMPRCILPGHPAYDIIKANMLELAECRTYEPDYQPKRFGILMTICTTLFPYCQADTPQTGVQDPGNEAVRQTMRYINSYYRRKIDLQTLADEVHLHPNYLCALFKEQTGKTVFAYIDRYRVRRATRLLHSSTLSVARIAESCGFGSVSFFSRKFRALIGMSPMQYRKHYASAAEQEDLTDI